jgi:hypothetical protein
MNDAYLDAAAAAVGLPIPDECRPGVLRYLQLVAGLAPRVMDFPLGTADEPATVFRPLGPEDLPADVDDEWPGVAR